MKSRGKYLAKNTALFALNSIGTKLIVFLLVPLYTAAFDTSQYGTIDLVGTIVTIMVPIITLNIGEAVMRFGLDKDSKTDDIMSVGLFWLAFSFIFSSLIVFVVSLFKSIQVDLRLVYLYCVAQGMYQTFSCNLRGQEKLLHYAIGNILNTFSVAILNVLFLVVLHLGLPGYFLAYILAYFIASIYCFFAGDVTSTLKHFHLDKNLLKNMTKYSIVLVPNSLMWWIMNSSDHMMVSSMISIAANGIYAVSYKLPSILSVISTIFNQAWSYSAIKENESKDRSEFNNAMFDNLIRVLALVTAFMLFVTRPLMSIYVSAQYYDAWKYMPYLLVGNFFLTLGTFLSTFYTVNKDSKGFLYSGSVGALLNVVLNFLLIPLMGIHGAALATCFSYMTVYIYRIIDTRKYMKVAVFRPVYILHYIMIVGCALTMLLPAMLGQILLFIELLLVMIINYKFILGIVSSALAIVKKKVKK